MTTGKLYLQMMMPTMVALVFWLQPVEADLVAYWPLNDGTGGATVTGADDVIASGTFYQDATVEGSGGTWVNDPTRGDVFSTGEDDRLVLGTQGIDRNVGFTWSLWAKVDSSNIADSGADVIIGSRAPNSGWNKIDIQSISNWASISYPGGSSFLADDTWHHLAYQGDLTSVRFYVDGNLIGADPTTTTQTINNKFELGGSSQFSEDITGLLSDVAVWNEALSITRIQDLAAGGPVILIPEPSSFALLSIGLLFFARMGRRPAHDQ
ncbi:MAG: hypothetical protein ACI9QL_004499 [Candidatus Omnitrophota bacterium]|jgi:hypothetical protein